MNHITKSQIKKYSQIDKPSTSDNKRWRIEFHYKTDRDWDMHGTPMQCFMTCGSKPSRREASRFAKRFTSEWTGWPEHRLIVYLDGVTWVR